MDARFEGMERKFEGVEGKLTAMDLKFATKEDVANLQSQIGTLYGVMQEGFQKVDQRFDEEHLHMSALMEQQIDRVHAVYGQKHVMLDDRVKRLEQKAGLLPSHA